MGARNVAGKWPLSFVGIGEAAPQTKTTLFRKNHMYTHTYNQRAAPAALHSEQVGAPPESRFHSARGTGRASHRLSWRPKRNAPGGDGTPPGEELAGRCFKVLHIVVTSQLSSWSHN